MMVIMIMMMMVMMVIMMIIVMMMIKTTTMTVMMMVMITMTKAMSDNTAVKNTFSSLIHCINLKPSQKLLNRNIRASARRVVSYRKLLHLPDGRYLFLIASKKLWLDCGVITDRGAT